MTYAGGKAKIAKALTAAMLALREPQHNTYIEPFMGGANVFCLMAPHFEKAIGSDVSKDLVLMWQALQQGWVPPKEVSEKEHFEQRLAQPSALRGYVGFGCSFRGVWFGGYGDEKCRSASWSTVQEQIKSMSHAKLMNADYRSLTQVSERCLIYCDPPYYATSGYSSGARHFDSQEFWQHVRGWVAQGALVFVSEYQGPTGSEVVWEGTKAMTLSAKTEGWKTATERLFRVTA